MSVKVTKNEDPEIGKTCVFKLISNICSFDLVFTELFTGVIIVNFCTHHFFQILYININLEQKVENFIYTNARMFV